MKKFFISLGIYAILGMGSFIILYAISICINQFMDGCHSYNETKSSFLTEWLGISYFKEKEKYESCMKAPDTFGLYKDLNQKSLSCVEASKEGSLLKACGEWNYKPGILYGLLGGLIVSGGVKLRKKYILKLSQ